MPHPFDRYANFTNLALLKQFSGKPLRKSIRVNTLKSTIEAFQDWAKGKGWEVQQVPWCPEGFFIDREDRSVALGKDLLHLLGHVYMQEAASMLPVALLDPKPGEVVLDMSAAPGSKTTQIAAKMQPSAAEVHEPLLRRVRGVIVANDVQEKRLWTLKTALYRLGCTNVIVTKKVGQWFGNNMTERFDRVLCDAPCTAQGTSRKDPTALQYCSDENISKMSKIQKQLLESAIHAAKVGGRIVYSTCTLTPEENEEVVAWALEKFEGKVEVVDVRNGELKMENGKLDKAIEDSHSVQSELRKNSQFSILNSPFPLLRLWPHTFDIEGFFCAVLQKTAPTKSREKHDAVWFQEKPLKRSKQKEIANQMEQRYGTSFLQEGDQLFEFNKQLLLATEDVMNFQLPVQNFSLGMPYARRAGQKGLRIDHELVTMRGYMAEENVMNLDEQSLEQLLDGKDIDCSENLRGDIILRCFNLPVGVGLAQNGILKNRLPRWLVQKS